MATIFALSITEVFFVFLSFSLNLILQFHCNGFLCPLLFSPSVYYKMNLFPFNFPVITFFKCVSVRYIFSVLFHSSIIGEDYENPTEERVRQSDVAVALFNNVDEKGTRAILPHCAGVQMMQTAPWSARCTAATSPTMRAVTSSPSVQLSSWRTRSPTRTNSLLNDGQGAVHFCRYVLCWLVRVQKSSNDARCV